METEPRRGERENPWTVEGLVRGASLLLERRIGAVWVEGEISGLRVHGSGHVYFALKDRGAQLAAVLWRSTAMKLGFRLEDGTRVVCRGRFGIYPDQGRFQMQVEAIEPAGLGAAALALEQLKKKLAAQGLFALERKRPLPRFPRRIGVVTSATGAALRDIVRCIERRFPTPVLLSPARVQGEGAAADIAEAIRRLYDRPGVDVIIVGRGGGSAEDLSAFQTEPVVRAIVHAPVPVISAVGHESDVTLADLAADVRASTPTAAAELAVPDRLALIEELGLLEARLRRDIRHVVDRRRLVLERLARRIADPARQLGRRRQQLDELVARAESALRTGWKRRARLLGELEKRLAALHPREDIAKSKALLARLEPRGEAAVRRMLAARRRALETLAGRLDAMSPLKVLERGYAIVRTPSGEVVTGVGSVAVGDELEVRVARGELAVRVEKVVTE
jgi:exodeoxyribonuclease VII large subunit